MSHRDRESKDRGTERRERPEGRKGRDGMQVDIVEKLAEQVRTMDSEIDLLKQKMNAVIRQMNVIKRVLLSEKGDIKGLQDEQELERKRFESVVEVVKEIKGSGQQP